MQLASTGASSAPIPNLSPPAQARRRSVASRCIKAVTAVQGPSRIEQVLTERAFGSEDTSTKEYSDALIAHRCRQRRDFPEHRLRVVGATDCLPPSDSDDCFQEGVADP